MNALSPSQNTSRAMPAGRLFHQTWYALTRRNGGEFACRRGGWVAAEDIAQASAGKSAEWVKYNLVPQREKEGGTISEIAIAVYPIDARVPDREGRRVDRVIVAVPVKAWWDNDSRAPKNHIVTHCPWQSVPGHKINGDALHAVTLPFSNGSDAETAFADAVAAINDQGRLDGVVYRRQPYEFRPAWRVIDVRPVIG